MRFKTFAIMMCTVSAAAASLAGASPFQAGREGTGQLVFFGRGVPSRIRLEGSVAITDDDVPVVLVAAVARPGSGKILHEYALYETATAAGCGWEGILQREPGVISTQRYAAEAFVTGDEIMETLYLSIQRGDAGWRLQVTTDRKEAALWSMDVVISKSSGKRAEGIEERTGYIYTLGPSKEELWLSVSNDVITRKGLSKDVDFTASPLTVGPKKETTFSYVWNKGGPR